METLPFYDEINSLYEKYLDRKVDYEGLCTYSKLFKTNKMNKDKLEFIIINSPEYKEKETKETPDTELTRSMKIGWDLIQAYKHDKKDEKDWLLKRNYKKSEHGMFTVLITNWKRLTFVRNCFESVIQAGITDIVISNCCLTKETLAFFKEVSDKYPFVKIVTTEADHGCNQLWLQGLYYVTTPYVLILHDDDELSSLMKGYKTIIDDILFYNENLSLLFWDAYILENEEISDEYHKSWKHPEGKYKAREFLTDYEKAIYPLSPVVQIMKTDLCIEVLSETKTYFQESKYYSKPTMMLGNEIMMTLRSLNQDSVIYYLDKPLTLYGRHEESESEIYVKDGSDVLKKGYLNARKYFAQHKEQVQQTDAQYIHVVNVWAPKHNEDYRRHKYAMNNWYSFYEKGDMVPRFMYDDEFTRMSDCVGDKRKMPFLHDIINIASQNLQDNDVILLTNADISFASDALVKLKQNVRKYGCTFSFRRDSTEPIEQMVYRSEDIQAEFAWYVGSDLFAFTKSWWKRWGGLFPDFIIGKPNWDWVMRVLMGYSVIGKKVFRQTLETYGTTVETKDIIYHEKHDSYAELQNVYMKDQANQWNWYLAKRWFQFMTQHKLDELDGGHVFQNIPALRHQGWHNYIETMERTWSSYT